MQLHSLDVIIQLSKDLHSFKTSHPNLASLSAMRLSRPVNHWTLGDVDHDCLDNVVSRVSAPTDEQATEPLEWPHWAPQRYLAGGLAS